MIFRVLDIETIPDPKAFTPNETTYKIVPSRVPAQVIEIEAAPQFLPPHANRVVAMSYVDVSFDAGQTPKYQFSRCYTECRWARDEAGLDAEERKLLSAFGAAMAEPGTHLVTWNGRTFDLPVIVFRSFRHRIPCSWYYGCKDVRYRYSVEGHCDLMDFLSDYGACRSMKLDDASRLVGLPGKDIPGEEHFDGSRVEGLVVRGDVQENKDRIARYCLQDVLQTALLFVRTRYHLEIVDALGYSKSVGTFAGAPAVREVLPIDWSKLLLDAEVGS